MFGPTAFTRDMAYYWFDTIQNWTTNKLDSLAGSLAGAPLNGWAGPIDMALSGEVRKLTMDLDTNSKSTDLLDCTGLRFGNCNATLPIHPNTWLPIFGVNQTIMEGAYEFNLPLIRDVTALKSVKLNGAARYTRYKNDPNDAALVSRTINATTWKVGLVWDVTDDVTVRLTRSRDIRAPSLYDLYLPVTTGNQTNGFDYLLSPGGVAINPRTKSGGNAFLDPEVGFTSTLGFVYRPSPNFSVSLDGYQIVMRNALSSLNGGSETIQKACYASGGSSSLCQLQDRPFGCCSNTTAANAATAFYTRFVNIAQQKTSGIDLEANFNTRVLEKPVSLRALVTYQPHILYYVPFAAVQDVAGVVSGQLGGLPAPVWKGSLYARFKLTDRLAVDLSQRYRSRLHFSSDPTAPLEDGGVGSVHYTNLSLSYDAPLSFGQASLFLNVQNLFNKEPPPASQINPGFPGQFLSTYAVGDDVVGSYYVAGVRFRL
jgi:outer membrane receptor protein involved in Fe transport